MKKIFRKLRQKAQGMYLKDILNFCEYKEQTKLLDIGCDDGAWTMKVAERIGTNDIYGIEIVEEAAQKAMEKGIQVSMSNISNIFPYADNYFDVIHSNQVIEHLYKTEHFVKEIFRVLKPDGYAVICTENLSSWHNIFSLIMGWMPMSSSNFSKIRYNVGNPLSIHSGDHTYLPESWQHIRVLSPKGIKDIFELHGFRTEKVRGAGYYPFPSFLARIDPTHAAFMTVKFRKPL